MRDKILAMEAGKELDALVVEKVTEYQSLTTALNLDGSYGYLPPYSSDISVAWEVVEKFKLSGFLINHLNDNPMGDGWHCVINHKHHARRCKTAPEAICKAALLAVMDS